MKNLQLVAFAFLFIIASSFHWANSSTKGTLQGKVTSVEGEALIGASIMTSDKSISTLTDLEGNYSLELPAGKYDLIFSYTGFASKTEKAVLIKSGETTTLNIKLQAGVMLDEMVMIGNVATEKRYATVFSPETYEEVIVEVSADATSDYDEPAMESAAVFKTAETSSPKFGIKSASSSRRKSASTTGKYLKGKKLKRKDHHLAGESFLWEGKMVSKNMIPMAELNPLEAIVLEKNRMLEEAKPKEKKLDAGKLTAGEWRDAEHWKAWKKQLEKVDFARAKKDWQMNLTERYAVAVSNKEGQALAGVMVDLMNKQNEKIWSSQTDNTGKAELWANIFGKEKELGKLKIVANYQGKKVTLKRIKSQKRVNHLEFDVPCNLSNSVDIMFAVDATGSMSDEINYLKAELQDVIQRVKNADDNLEIRLGSVFYRDEGDEYLTQSTPLDSDIKKTVDFIKAQRANGGGDFPEAVDAALVEAIEKQNWNKKAIAKIVFLILDAPPHMQQKNIATLQESVRAAAEKGIKIIPITASGINRTTEYLMKSMALATHGTYVYLTDDSGIGNSHLKPSNKEVKVEFLNDLMVRLLGEFTSRKSCEEDEELYQAVAFPDNNTSTNSSTLIFQEDPSILRSVKYFPNPAIDRITIQLQEFISLIEIIQPNGQVVKRLENVAAGTTEVELGELSEGFYLIRFKKDKAVASGKLIIIRP